MLSEEKHFSAIQDSHQKKMIIPSEIIYIRL